MIYTTDSLTSLVSGMGNVQRDKLASTTYSYVELTDEQLTNAYRNSWVAKRLVDVPAMDAIKNWRVWQTDNDSLNALEDYESKLSIKQKLLQTIIASRALGGAGLYIGTKDQDLLQPLDASKIKKDGRSPSHRWFRKSAGAALDALPSSPSHRWFRKFGAWR